MAQFKEKYNESCIKIFNLISLLYKNKANYNEVIRVLSDEIHKATPVIVNKYINTLKIFGVNIQKNKNEFHMLNAPFPVDFALNDLKALNIIESIIKTFPEGKTKINIQELINDVINKFNIETKKIYDQLNKIENDSFYYQNLKTRIECCEKYCNDDYKIYITYLKDGQQISEQCKAQEMIFDKKQVYIRIYKSNKNQYENIPLQNIQEIKQLPIKNNSMIASYSAVYTLSGRLAKAYSLKENEMLTKINPDGSIVITVTNEPQDDLIKRLIRYDIHCKINSPESLKEKMERTIKTILQKYS